MRNATGRWQQEAATRHTQLLDKLRRGLTVPDMTPHQREHVDTCMRSLDAALNCPTPHLDLSLLPPGHALSDDALDPFMQQRSIVSPPLRSITLPARSTRLPSYLKHFPTLEFVHAPDFAGEPQNLSVGALWKTVQLGYLTPANSPTLMANGVVVDTPDPKAVKGVEIILRPASDGVAQRSFSQLAAGFVRLFRVGSCHHREAVVLAALLTHALHAYSPTLDLSHVDRDILDRAARFGLFERFDASHRPRGPYAKQRPDLGRTAYFLPSEATIELSLPQDLAGEPWWLAQFKGRRVP